MGRIVKTLLSVLLASAITASITACGGQTTTTGTSASTTTVKTESIEDLAKQEGKLVSVGMPDDWANWKDTFDQLTAKYNITHTDTDMSSAEEISKMEAEKDKPTADIGDIGITFAPIAVSKGITTPFKHSHWKDVPDWAKDKDGNWCVGYTGTIAFLTNKKLVKNPPKSWDDILKGDYRVTIGDVTKAAQSQSSVLAAAFALGGDEKNIQPALDYFAKLSKQKRLTFNNPGIADLEKGEIQVAILWDFNAINYAEKIGRDNFEICIPAEASLISGYAQIINKYAPHPNAAKAAIEYIFSDQGQINFAKGYARPIRSNITLPDDIKAKMIPSEQYKNVRTIKDFTVWGETAKKLPQLWQDNVLINMQ